MSSNLPTNRILSLDVFRGLTIVLMILVNSPGTRFPYSLLEHANWNGCTLADLVFPAFLFIVGITLTISLRVQTGVLATIIQRSLILFLLGLFLNAFPFHYDLGTLRIVGVLQRIAICYFVCSLLYLNTSIKAQGVIFVIVLLFYWLMMTMVPVPGYGANQLTPAGTWVSYIDQMVFSSPRLYAKVYDPEGIFSTLSAIATTLSGMLIGHLLLSNFSKQRKCYLILVTGLGFMLCGWLWSFNFPINKNIWTSSFVLWTSGISTLVFACCYYIIDICGSSKWAFPFKVFGMNALFAFVLHVILLKIQFAIYLPLRSGASDNMKAAISDYLFGSLSMQNASLAYSLLFLLFNFVIVYYLYQRKIFIRL